MNCYSGILRERFRNSHLGRLLPELADAVAKVFEDKTVTRTKENYVSVLRHYWNFMLCVGLNPLQVPLDPMHCIFYLQERINMSGSIASSSTWTATFNWISEIAGAPTSYKHDIEYITYLKAINKKYNKGKDQRMPFTRAHINKYNITLWNKDMEQHGYVKYDTLMKLLLINIYFFTMSRPAELLRSKSANKINGLKYEDLHKSRDEEHGVLIYELDIQNYKNAASRQIIKKIYIADNKCRKIDCTECTLSNPFALLHSMLKRRKNLYRKATAKYWATRTTSYSSVHWRNRAMSLKLKNNPLFVWENGNEINTTELGDLAKEVAAINGVLKPQQYTAYSLRIGGTTAAAIAGIEHPMILKYVGWSSSRLADCAQRYMRYSPFQLCRVPFMMIHGANKYNNRHRQIAKIYDPWSERLNPKYYRN